MCCCINPCFPQKEISDVVKQLSSGAFTFKCTLHWMAWADKLSPVDLMLAILIVSTLVVVSMIYAAIRASCKAEESEVTVTTTTVQMVQNPIGRGS